MAKEKPRCVLCGQETEFFRRASLPLYNTNQIVCTACKQMYESANREERNRLKEQMLQSPYLWDGERIQSLLKWKREEEERRAARENLNVLTAARRDQSTICCGQRMNLLGATRFQIHPVGLMGEESGMMDMTVYECQLCGRLKFFKPVPHEG